MLCFNRFLFIYWKADLDFEYNKRYPNYQCDNLDLIIELMSMQSHGSDQNKGIIYRLLENNESKWGRNGALCAIAQQKIKAKIAAYST